jgi:hypothetical protein
MAFPWIFSSNWETGAIEWDSETDSANQLDIAHYTDLAALPYGTAAPFSGAYCLRTALTGGTADAFLVEADVNIALNALNYFHFNIWFSPDFDATLDDTVNVLELVNSCAVAEATFGFRYDASEDTIELGIGETAPTSFGVGIKRGVWYTVELTVEIDAGGGNDGTIDIRITEENHPYNSVVYATQVASLDQAAVTDARLGVQDHLATTTGVILIDNFIHDDGQVFPSRRFPTEYTAQATEHAFVGQGLIDVELISGAGTDNTLSLYDTDRQEDDGLGNRIDYIANLTNNEIVPSRGPMEVRKGAYIVLAGTNPQVKVRISRASAYNPAAMRSLAGR